MKVLDNGFVQAVDMMGNDDAIVQAARVSYGAGTKTPSDDRTLIRHLMRHRHTTPFEMCEIKLHIKMPIFVARQWVRHRTASINEVSARYSVLSNDFYVPDTKHIGRQSKTNKQGTDTGGMRQLSKDAIKDDIMSSSASAYGYYTDALQEGASREQARMVLPVNIYTEWYWKTNLHNLFHFLKLRADPHAQWEIRQYADVICRIVEAWCPVAWEAFNDYQLKAATLSRMELDIVRDMLARHISGFRHSVETSGLTKREQDELLAKVTY